MTKGKRNFVLYDIFLSLLAIESDYCIDWKHSKTKGGYGQVYKDGRVHYTHILANIMRNGRGDERKPHTLHSCHNRLCMNYKHLRWGDDSDNAADRVKDGTENYGERQGGSKLKKSDVIKIRKSTDSQMELSRKYGVSQSNIHAIINFRSWRHI